MDDVVKSTAALDLQEPEALERADAEDDPMMASTSSAAIEPTPSTSLAANGNFPSKSRKAK